MSWIADNFGLIVFAIVVYSMWRKAKAFLDRAREEAAARGERSRPEVNTVPEDARRVREIQEEIRRKIAERRSGGEREVGRTPAQRTFETPALPRVPPADPFGGGTMRRAFAELERRLEPAPPRLSEQQQRNTLAQLERQEQLAEQARVLEESRRLAERRASERAAAARAEAATAGVKVGLSREALLADLRNPESFKRAFVLREVLGSPVAFR